MTREEALVILKNIKTTNREWLEGLSDKELAGMIAYGVCSKTCAYKGKCGGGDDVCIEGITKWLQEEHKEPKKELTQAQLCEAFELKFGKRRAISLDEIREVTKEIFK